MLALKGVSYDNVPVHLVKEGGKQRTDDYRKKNAMMQVPVLEWQDGARTRRLSQSVAICCYLEEKHPTPSLFPSAAEGRARVLELVEVVNSGIQPLQNLRVLQDLSAAGLDREEWSRDIICRGFDALETMLLETSGRFAFGDSITMADVFIVPQVYNARRFNVDLARYPTITRIDRCCAAEEAFPGGGTRSTARRSCCGLTPSCRTPQA